MRYLNQSVQEKRLSSAKMAALFLGVSLGLQAMLPADATTLPVLLPETQTEIPRDTVNDLFAMQALPQPHLIAQGEGHGCGAKCGSKCGSKCGAHACGGSHSCGGTCPPPPPPPPPPGNPGGTGGPNPGGPAPNPPATSTGAPPGIGGLFPAPPPITRSTLPVPQCSLIIADDRILGSPRALSYLNNYPCSYVVLQSAPPMIAAPPPPVVEEIPVAAPAPPPPPPVVIPPPVEKKIPIRGYW